MLSCACDSVPFNLSCFSTLLHTHQHASTIIVLQQTRSWLQANMISSHYDWWLQLVWLELAWFTISLFILQRFFILLFSSFCCRYFYRKRSRRMFKTALNHYLYEIIFFVTVVAADSSVFSLDFFTNLWCNFANYIYFFLSHHLFLFFFLFSFFWFFVVFSSKVVKNCCCSFKIQNNGKKLRPWHSSWTPFW